MQCTTECEGGGRSHNRSLLMKQKNGGIACNTNEAAGARPAAGGAAGAAMYIAILFLLQTRSRWGTRGSNVTASYPAGGILLLRTRSLRPPGEHILRERESRLTMNANTMNRLTRTHLMASIFWQQPLWRKDCWRTGVWRKQIWSQSSGVHVLASIFRRSFSGVHLLVRRVPQFVCTGTASPQFICTLVFAVVDGHGFWNFWCRLFARLLTESCCRSAASQTFAFASPQGRSLAERFFRRRLGHGPAVACKP